MAILVSTIPPDHARSSRSYPLALSQPSPKPKEPARVNSPLRCPHGRDEEPSRCIIRGARKPSNSQIIEDLFYLRRCSPQPVQLISRETRLNTVCRDVFYSRASARLPSRFQVDKTIGTERHVRQAGDFGVPECAVQDGHACTRTAAAQAIESVEELLRTARSILAIHGTGYGIMRGMLGVRKQRCVGADPRSRLLRGLRGGRAAVVLHLHTQVASRRLPWPLCRPR